MAKNPKLSLENQICHSLYSATNAMVRAYRPLLDELDLTYPQYLVMLALWEEDGVMIKNLVERTRIDAGTLTPLLKRMQLKSLINMTKSDEDSRQKVVVLTKEGQDLIEMAEDIPDKLLCNIDMEKQDAAELKRLSEELFLLLSRQESHKQEPKKERL
jgi:DNA-binding MarR family transcriptional regulator